MTSINPTTFSAMIDANKAQYMTTTNLDVRQQFNKLPREKNVEIWKILSDHYKTINFMEGEGQTLEVGAGNGLFWKEIDQEILPSLLKQGKVYITDSSEGMVEACKKKDFAAIEDVIVETCDVAKMTYGDSSMKRIIANFMLYECKTEDKVIAGIKEMARVLQPDGKAIIVAMNEEAHMIQLYSTLEQAQERLKKKGFIIATKFPHQAPAILPFCKGNAEKYLRPCFKEIKMTSNPNAILVHEQMENCEISGPEFVVMYLQSLAFVQEAMKKGELTEMFFKEIENIVREEIKSQGVFRITREDIIFDCSNPVK